MQAKKPSKGNLKQVSSFNTIKEDYNDHSENMYEHKLLKKKSNSLRPSAVLIVDDSKEEPKHGGGPRSNKSTPGFRKQNLSSTDSLK